MEDNKNQDSSLDERDCRNHQSQLIYTRPATSFQMGPDNESMQKYLGFES